MPATFYYMFKDGLNTGQVCITLKLSNGAVVEAEAVRFKGSFYILSNSHALSGTFPTELKSFFKQFNYCIILNDNPSSFDHVIKEYRIVDMKFSSTSTSASPSKSRLLDLIRCNTDNIVYIQGDSFVGQITAKVVKLREYYYLVYDGSLAGFTHGSSLHTSLAEFGTYYTSINKATDEDLIKLKLYFICGTGYGDRWVDLRLSSSPSATKSHLIEPKTERKFPEYVPSFESPKNSESPVKVNIIRSKHFLNVNQNE